jgi:hypothetical protein
MVPINQGFSYLFCLLIEGSGSVQTMTDLDPGGQKTYGSGATTLKLVTTISYSFGAVQYHS